MRTLPLPLTVALFLILTSSHALTPISSCGNYSASNEAFVLTADLIAVGENATCIVLKGENVSLNGNGYTISGDGSPGQVGVFMENANQTVENVTFSRIPTGIFMKYTASNSRVAFNRFEIAENATGIAVDTYAGSGLPVLWNLTFEENVFLGPGKDVESTGWRNVNIMGIGNLTLKNNVFRNLKEGFYFDPWRTTLGIAVRGNRWENVSLGLRISGAAVPDVVDSEVCFEADTCYYVSNSVGLNTSFINVSVENVSVKGIYVRASYALVDNCSFKNVTNIALESYMTGLLEATNSYFSQASTSAIHVWRGGSARIVGNVFENMSPSKGAIMLEGIGGENYVANNTVIGGIKGGWYGNGNLTVENNTVMGDINLPFYTLGAKVYNNTVIGGVNIYISTNPTRPTLVANNTIATIIISELRCSGVGYLLPVENNTITAPSPVSSRPLQLTGCKGNASHWYEFRNNVFENITQTYPRGYLIVYNSDFVKIYNNIFRNLSTTFTNAVGAIQLTSYSTTGAALVHDVIIYNNTVNISERAGLACVNVYAYNNASYENITVENNSFLRCGMLAWLVARYPPPNFPRNVTFRNNYAAFTNPSGFWVKILTDSQFSDFYAEPNLLPSGVVISGNTLENVTFSNITGRLSIEVADSKDVAVSNVSIWEGSIAFDSVHNFTLEGVRVENSSDKAVEAVGSEGVIRNSVLLPSGGEGIYSYLSNISLENLSVGGAGVAFYGENSYLNITSSTLFNSGECGALNSSQAVIYNTSFENCTVGLSSNLSNISTAESTVLEAEVGVLSSAPSKIESRGLELFSIGEAGLKGSFRDSNLSEIVFDNVATAFIFFNSENLEIAENSYTHTGKALHAENSTNILMRDAFAGEYGIELLNVSNFSFYGSIDTLELPFYGRDSSYIHVEANLRTALANALEGLNLSYFSLIYSNISGAVVIENSTNSLLALSSFQGPVVIDPTSNTLIENSTITATGAPALTIDGDNNTVRNNTISSDVLALNLTRDKQPHLQQLPSLPQPPGGSLLLSKLLQHFPFLPPLQRGKRHSPSRKLLRLPSRGRLLPNLLG